MHILQILTIAKSLDFSVFLPKLALLYSDIPQIGFTEIAHLLLSDRALTWLQVKNEHKTPSNNQENY